MNEIIWKKSESDAGKQYGMNNEWIQIYIEKSIWVKKKYTKIMWVWVVNKIDNRSTEWMAILDCNMEFCAVSFGQTPINNIHACTHTYIFFLSLSSPAKSEYINLSICQNGIVVGFFPFILSYIVLHLSSSCDVYTSLFLWTDFFFLGSLLLISMDYFDLHARLYCYNFACISLSVLLSLSTWCVFFSSCMRLRHILVRQYHRIVVIVLLYCCCYFVISYRQCVCVSVFFLYSASVQ